MKRELIIPRTGHLELSGDGVGDTAEPETPYMGCHQPCRYVLR